MKKVLAIGGSNSRHSINAVFAAWAAGQVEDAQVTVADLNDYEMPIYGEDREREEGIPQQAHAFKALINEADAVVVSLAEHNGSYAVAYKNITDWVSRIERGTWSNKPLLLMSTSPGPRGAATVLETAKSTIPYHGAQLVGSFILPSFNDNFDLDQGITNPELLKSFNQNLELLELAIKEEGIEVSL